MTMNDANVKCLLHCSENILQCEVKLISDFRNLELFCQMLNDKPMELDIEHLLLSLTRTFGFNIEDALNLKDKDLLTECELLKILLLCVVVYILTNNDKNGSEKLNNLCDNIPIDLHQNACMMFAPLIVKFSNKEEITYKDLENALLLNDKENQTTFFSPIREKYRPHFVNDKKITSQKQKIYRDLKAYQSFDPFPLEMGTPPHPNSSSPLIQLVEYVQSPDCQEKIALRKTNKVLEKNLHQLEHQLFLNNSFENELDKVINVWKQKYMNLEKESKSLQTLINEKDDLIQEKSKEIDKLKNIAYQNKKLEDKSKDYQEKIYEIQMLNGQLEEKCEEIRNLKIENRESSHFKALAIDRRTIIKNLTSQIENYKLIEIEFHETCVLLKKTQSELNELQNNFHSLQQNKNSDSFSELSLNSSIYNPESMAGIVEMERDELKTELLQLKEQSVPKLHYECAVGQINQLNQTLADSVTQCSQLKQEKEAITKFCEIIKENMTDLQLIETTEIPDNECLIIIQEMFRKTHKTITSLKENIDQLSLANNILTNDINQKVEIEKNFLLEIESNRREIEKIDLELNEMKKLLFSDQIFDIRSSEFFIEIKNKFLSYQQTLEQNDVTIKDFKTQTQFIVQKLRDEISTVSQILKNIIESICTDIQDFKIIISNDSPNEISFSNPFIESLYELYNLLKDQKCDRDQLYHNNKELFTNLEKIQSEFDKNFEDNQRKIKEFEKLKNEIILKHTNEKLEMKVEMSKLIDSLANLEEVSFQYEEQIKIKDNQIENDKKVLIKSEHDIITLRNENERAKMQIDRLSTQIHELNTELSANCDRRTSELHIKNQEISKLEALIDEIKIINNDYLTEIETLKVTNELGKLNLEKYETDQNRFINEILLKDEEIKTLVEDKKNKIQTIFGMEVNIDQKQRENIEKQNRINELENKLIMLEKDNKITAEELNQMKTRNKEIEILKINLENKLDIKEKEILAVNEGRMKLENDLILKKEEIIFLTANNSFEIDKLKNAHEKQKIEDRESLEKHEEEMKNFRILLEEKEKEICKNNENVILLENRIEEMKINVDYLKLIDEKYVELSKVHQELEWRFEKSLKENLDSMNTKNLEIEGMKTEIDRLTEMEQQWIREKEEKDVKLSSWQQESTVTKSAIDCLKDKYSKLDEEYKLLSMRSCKLNHEHYVAISEKNKTVDDLNEKLLGMDNFNQVLKKSIEEYSEKMSIFEDTIASKTKEINCLHDKLDSSSGEIESLKIKLKSQIDIENSKEEIMRDLELKLYQMETEKMNLERSIVDLNCKVEIANASNDQKQAEIDKVLNESNIEIGSLKQTVSNLSSELESFQEKLDSIVKDKEAKSQELSAANISLIDFHSKIRNLELIINEEMHNYEKVTEEYKQVEQESNCYRERYNNLLKLNRDESLSYQNQIAKLTEHIHKLEEEQDNQIHEMEKSFNTKIFDLQQNLDDKTSELESMKSEITETRRFNKTARVNLELEKNRLQKAITTRETQFSEEKAQMILNLEKERIEKLKYKEHYEGVICKLENDIDTSEQRSKKEYSELKDEFNRLNEQLKETQLSRFKIAEENKQKELEFQKEKEALEIRLEELEPMENKISELESTTHRLLNKLTALEQSVSAKELKNLKSEIKTSKASVVMLENDKKELISNLMSLENKLKNQVHHNNEITKDKNELTNKLNCLQDQLYNFESLDKTRLSKIENIEREIESIKSENLSIKSRYLKLREISEVHLEKINRSHEDTVKNYIERIGSLTKDVANFQDQVQLLITEKNLFKEYNSALKRSVFELTSQYNNLQTVLQEHTANEVRLMNEKYGENNRYLRMSDWESRPQISHHLPPVSSLDNDSVADLNLNPKSKLRFESYIFNPYNCEDESNICLLKEFSKPVVSSEISVPKIDDDFTQISSSTEKKKHGIRHQIATKIRRSLHLEGSSQLQPQKNNIDEICSSSIKSESTTSCAKPSSKPPVLPRKKFIKSSQINVIDLDQFRSRKDKKSPPKSSKISKLKNVSSVSNTPTSHVVSSTSMNSLFDRDDGTSNAENENLLTNSPNQIKKLSGVVLRTPYAQRPKTPKPNSVIRRLIQKSKAKTPFKKCSSIDKMFQY